MHYKDDIIKKYHIHMYDINIYIYIYIYIYRKMRWYSWVYVLPHSVYHIDESIIPIYNI
jgi:hypothetical protein